MATLRISLTILLLLVLGITPDGSSQQSEKKKMRLSHEQTLEWINSHRAWRIARKTKPIWVRPIDDSEIGKEFQTADHTVEKAKSGYWLCVGVAGEPWFQRPDRVQNKYTLAGDETKKFAFDSESRNYQRYQPKEGARNWAARINDPAVEGFYIRPNYEVEKPLYSPTGGYVVKDYVDDPYHDKPDDVWLVQKSLFESTYEFMPDSK